jgi:Hypervirulence associated proteins TUDOR domain
MAKQFKPGDRVNWDTPQGETRGKVVRKLTSKTRIKGHTAKADPEHPQYLVESEKSGTRAAHKPDALKKG